MIKLASLNFVPFLSVDSKGFIGFVNAKLSDETGKSIIAINSIGCYANRFDSLEKIHLTMPAKKLDTNYNFFFEILDKDLLEEIRLKAEQQIVEKGYLTFFNEKEK